MSVVLYCGSFSLIKVGDPPQRLGLEYRYKCRDVGAGPGPHQATVPTMTHTQVWVVSCRAGPLSSLLQDVLRSRTHHPALYSVISKQTYNDNDEHVTADDADAPSTLRDGPCHTAEATPPASASCDGVYVPCRESADRKSVV